MSNHEPVHSTIRPLKPTKDSGRVAKEISRCLELVQTCNRDLQHLIDLRNEHLEFLQTTPRRILERVNSVIDSANQSLVEARRIVEKCRPKAHHGMKMTFHSQVDWVIRSSVHFRRQEPVIIRHNTAVLAELTYLRQITTWTIVDSVVRKREGTVGPSNDRLRNAKKMSVIDKPAAKMVPMPMPMPRSRFSTRKPIEYCDLPEPVFPNALPRMTQSAEELPLPDRRSSVAHITTYFEYRSSSAIPGTSDDRGLLVLFGD
ncbi:hypothetical protein NOR_06197 [Metarhizium rileyi]|uniref:Uncharacterized protein n=1 Tax=Metarhizium rileyi (strain RCEF 4871) TaxID=1649241 RepID=A0A167AV40_METRR|nr:hypothetical protein NOR_06197 [Metarhizium rileyi RCEF 4871]